MVEAGEDLYVSDERAVSSSDVSSGDGKSLSGATIPANSASFLSGKENELEKKKKIRDKFITVDIFFPQNQRRHNHT